MADAIKQRILAQRVISVCNADFPTAQMVEFMEQTPEAQAELKEEILNLIGEEMESRVLEAFATGETTEESVKQICYCQPTCSFCHCLKSE